MTKKHLQQKTVVLLDPVGEHGITVLSEQVDVIVIMTKSTEATVKVELNETGGVGRILGLVMGSEASTIRLRTDQFHTAKACTSNLLIKSVLSGGSNFFFEGAIRVAIDAQKTDALQRNENLLLDSLSRAESRPMLEIQANDVRCTHAATVQPIPKQELWYLATRGLEVHDAKRMLIQGFLQAVIDEIQDATIQKTIAKQVEIHLQKQLGG